MATKLSTFLTVVDELAFEGDSSKELSDDARYRQIRAAVLQYSHDAPALAVEDESGDGGKYYAISLLEDWSEGFSRVTQIEYPAATVADDEAPTYLEADTYDWSYWAGGIRYIYFESASPAATDTWRVSYTYPYDWAASTVTTDVEQTAHGFSVDDYIYNDATEWVEASGENLATHQVSTITDVDNFVCKILQTTTPMGDFQAICHLAACLICRAIATKYSRIGDSLVSADAGAHTTKAQEFSARAKAFCDLYAGTMGLLADAEARDAPAGSFVDLDTKPGWRRGRRYLFHHNR